MQVILRYYKIPSGKWYADGSYTSPRDAFYEVINEVRTMLSLGKAPGLRDSIGPRTDMFVLVRPELDSACELDHLIDPREDFNREIADREL